MKQIISWLSGFLPAGLVLFSVSYAFAEDIRQPAVAGAFYPGDSLKLARVVTEMLTHSKVVTPRVKPTGMISPHAGYRYSGPVAAFGYKQLKGYKYSTVVVIAPSHREYFNHAAVYCQGGYRTPLGTVEVDSELAGRIVNSAGGELVKCSERGHSQQMGEHSLEVQLPFLQLVLGNFKLVPIVMGDQNAVLCEALARALAETAGGRDDVLLVASSDLSHFHGYDEANRIDGKLISYVEKYNYRGLGAALGRGEVEACGGAPIMAVMKACEKLGAGKVRIVAYANSGDIAGERNRVVGYLSALFYKSDLLEKEAEHSSNSGGPMGLSEKEKEYLLKLARQSIVNAVLGRQAPVPEMSTPILAENRGAFVTIKKRGELRGCIGYILAVKPLTETICEMAQAAALRDPRFSPVTEDELDELELEISVLTPIQEVKDVNSIEVGKDGLIIRRGNFQGLLLPQVATEYGWDRETFLAQTCRKAGLPLDAWKLEDTEISAFRAEVFGEE